MNSAKADIITQLKKDILPLQGFRPLYRNAALDEDIGSLNHAFPNASFPVGVIHELVFDQEDFATTVGFVGGILASLMKKGGASVWISCSQNIFPPALQSFGIAPDKIIFIQVKKEKELLWVMEETLKCHGLCAVIGEMRNLSFTSSRRLQLAVEESHVTGFVLCRNALNLNTNVCVSRWKITPLPSQPEAAMPGVGFPRWNIELLKIRNGRPGKWEMEFKAGVLRPIIKIAAISLEQQQKKTG